MRHVEVTSSYFEKSPYIYITNSDEFAEYCKALDEGVSETIEKALKSGVPPEKFDHIVQRDNIGDQVLAVSFSKAHINGGSPLLGMGEVMTEKMERIGNHLIKYGHVLINKSGGYCHAAADWIITDVESPAPKPKFRFANDPSFINLENDAHIELHTRKWFRENNYELSFLKKMRSFSIDGLTKVFIDFKNAGGYGAYIYTTAVDERQVHDYCEAIIDAGLTEVVFEFNAGEPSEYVREALDKLIGTGISVKIN